MARGTWADAVRVREGRRALERRRGDPFVRKKHNRAQREASIPVIRNVRAAGVLRSVRPQALAVAKKRRRSSTVLGTRYPRGCEKACS